MADPNDRQIAWHQFTEAEYNNFVEYDWYFFLPFRIVPQILMWMQELFITKIETIRRPPIRSIQDE